MKPLWGWGEAHSSLVESDMASKARTVANPCVDADTIYLIFDKKITPQQLAIGKTKGCLFSAKMPKDDTLFEVWETVLTDALSINPGSFFKKLVVQTAFERFANKQSNDGIDSNVPARIQAFNFCQYFSALRSIKKSMVTGLRLNMSVRRLVDHITLLRPDIFIK